MFLDNKEINMYIPWVHIKTDKEYACLTGEKGNKAI